MFESLFILFVTQIFFLIALFLYWRNRYYRLNGRETSAVVKAFIQKFSRSRNKSSTIVYAPVVEYSYQGGLTSIVLEGSSVIDKQVGQTVTLLTLEDGPDYAILKEQKNSSFFIFVFGVIGLVGAYGYWMLNPLDSSLKISILVFIPFFIRFFFKQMIVKLSKGKFQTRQLLKSAQIFSGKVKNREKLIDQNDQIQKMNSSTEKVAFGISIVFLLLASIGLFFSFNNLDPASLGLIQELMQGHFEVLKNIENPSPTLVFFFVAVFFSFFGLLGFIQTLRKSGEIRRNR